MVSSCYTTGCITKEGEFIPEGTKGRSDNCKFSYECRSGRIRYRRRSCPANSKCNSNKCLCNQDYRTTLDENGFVTSCRYVHCYFGGKLIKEKERVRSQNCNRILECRSGRFQTSRGICPDHSTCQSGKCVCDQHYEAVVDEYGMVSSCYTTMCQINGEYISDKSKGLTLDCQQTYECQSGTLKYTPGLCPDNSYCKSGKCVCKTNYISVRDIYGLVIRCDEIEKTCRPGYHAYGYKCYKFVSNYLDWHSAAINCGIDGSNLARYDDENSDVLDDFMKDLPEIYSREHAERQTVYCEPGAACKLPDNCLGLHVRLKTTVNELMCRGNYKLSGDARSIVVKGNCRANFVVTFMRVYLKDKPNSRNIWIGGNSKVISLKKRYDEDPFQIDLPRKIEHSSYQDRIGCFQARLNCDNELIITPNPDCTQRKTSICEYDNYCPPSNKSAYIGDFIVKRFNTLEELRYLLARNGNQIYVCERPLNIECRALDNATGKWVTNYDQTGDVLTCNAYSIECRRNEGLDCDTFKVRFLCPIEENQCRILADIEVFPCSNGRLCLPVRNHYICRCPDGKKYNEITQACPDPCGTCLARRGPYYKTLNGNSFDLPGDCMYKFTGMCNYTEFESNPNFDVYTKYNGSSLVYIEIHLRNIPTGPGGTIFKKNFVFKVTKGNHKYELDDQKMSQAEFEMKGAFKVSRRPNFFELYSDILDINVRFAGSRLTVTVPNAYNGKMCGLCGDCTTDEFRLKNGTLVSVPKISPRSQKYDDELIIPVANEWIVPYAEATNPQAYAESCLKVKPPVDDCSTGDYEADFKSPNWCGVFKDSSSCISQCFSKIDPNEFYEDCMSDVCKGDPETELCNLVEDYVQSCAEENIPLNWRSDSFCPMDCGNKVYSTDASCQTTCGRDALAEYTCSEEPKEGCVCPTGLILEGDDCVEPNECGCDITLNELEYMWHLSPSESILLPGCLKIVRCVPRENGTTEELYEPYSLPMNAICIDGPPTKIGCISGYELQNDTLTCKRIPKKCYGGYVNKADILCIKKIGQEKIWRHAISMCNEQDGTLVVADTEEKILEIKNLMKDNSYKQVFISGQVTAKVGDNATITFEPLVEYSQTIKEAYRNYHVALSNPTKIILSDKINIDDVQGNGVVLALVLRLNEDDSYSIVAVPRDSANKFICEERDTPDNQRKFYGPCNSDSKLDDGDVETKTSLENAGCVLCPVPYEIDCTEVPESIGSEIGDCEMTQSGTYYSCLHGTDCKDHEIRTKCTEDTNECDDGIDDCPTFSQCINNIGAYSCKCDDDHPLMVNGHCLGILTCSVEGPETGLDYVYDFNGFSNIPGYFDYTCQFMIAGVCVNKYDPSSGLPFVQIHSTGNRSAVSGVIIEDHLLRNALVWSVNPYVLAEGKFFIGSNSEDIVKRDLGDLFGKIHVPYTGSNIFTIYHEDNYFKAVISFPLRIQLEFTDNYAPMMCGACSMQPDSSEGYIILTPDEIADITANNDSLCERYIPPTTTPTTSSTPSTTTVDSCEARAACYSLTDLCSTSLDACFDSVCDGVNKMSICKYLLLLSVNGSGGCSGGDKMAEFLEEISCGEEECGDNMKFAHTSRRQPTCQNPNVVDFDSFRSTNVFSCVCDDGRTMSNDECVPTNECGCLDENSGTYYKLGEIWNNENCTESYMCEGGNIIETATVECADNANCVQSDEGYYSCQCNEGYFGNGDQENGCVPPDEEDDGSKLCFNTTDNSNTVQRTCICNHGYSSINCSSVCTDINECFGNLHQCDSLSQKCVNLPGTYRCECAEGFNLQEGRCLRSFSRRLCQDEPYEELITIKGSSRNNSTCLDRLVSVKSCESLGCEKGIDACCTPSQSAEVRVTLDCYDDETSLLVRTETKVHFEAVKCQCTDLLSDDALDDPFGGGLSGGGGGSSSDPFGIDNTDPFGDSGDDPFGIDNTDPFGDSGGDPFGIDNTDPFGGSGVDDFGGDNTDPFGADPFGGGDFF